jgi:tetratricopeptide (TPR) repeat protein
VLENTGVTFIVNYHHTIIIDTLHAFLMKFLLTIVFLTVVSSNIFAQADIVQSEPTLLYHEINTSLAEGHPKQAIHQFRKVIDFYKQENRENEIPQNYFGMALAFAFSGHYKESIRYHKKAIRAHHQYRRAKEDPIEMVINLGLTYELAGKMRKARKMMSS